MKAEFWVLPSEGHLLNPCSDLQTLEATARSSSSVITIRWTKLKVEAGPIHQLMVTISLALTMTRYFAEVIDILLRAVW